LHLLKQEPHRSRALLKLFTADEDFTVGLGAAFYEFCEVNAVKFGDLLRLFNTTAIKNKSFFR
jgi:hypothetical protein